MLTDGYHDVPAGRLAMVVTHLEMHAKPATTQVCLPDGITLRAVPSPTLDWYRDIYRRVGADWLWFSRLELSDADLAAIIHDPKVRIFTLSVNGQDEALLELDFRHDGACELAFFGLTDTLIGQGVGRGLMAHAIQMAWAEPITLFHVHTCTLDSPQALSFYRRSGFTPMRQQIEIAPDNRIKGTAGFTRNHAPHVPIFD
ncbi:hypothetical protein ASD8599_03554 [Ascidiaceihabitans donghaensis]|uniref:N-acetyltransferase domain-containing protein n=1 Tax=Ascidiaceihabitans donghaensis TaxID=1510460 RepID=A0A2R8BIA0_9RHOB|nr:GNAT family N-acetyltransferase [Ascidiaceihabitans donghaensis]SPH22807.1 hypothetical protein ASD8599_03554 [Ascidiaceihabitans donghaensis]